jgi:hypothetical protein
MNIKELIKDKNKQLRKRKQEKQLNRHGFIVLSNEEIIKQKDAKNWIILPDGDAISKEFLERDGFLKRKDSEVKNKYYLMLQKIDLKDLIEKSEFINLLCVDTYPDCNNCEKSEGGCQAKYNLIPQHSLPLKNKEENYLSKDNWNIPDDERRIIEKCMKPLYEYSSIVVKAFGGAYEKPIHEVDIEILPPWIVFPLYQPSSMVWRMGPGEDYGAVFSRMISNADKEKLRYYITHYPIPDYMKPMGWYNWWM